MSSSVSQEVTYLVPPLVLPTALLPSVADIGSTSNPWYVLGSCISRSTSRSSGGLVLGSSDSSSWCGQYTSNGSVEAPLSANVSSIAPEAGLLSAESDVLRAGNVIFVTHFSESHFLVPIICALARHDNRVTVFVLHDEEDGAGYFGECRNMISLVTVALQTPSDQVKAVIIDHLDVLISAVEEEALTQLLTRFGVPQLSVRVVGIPKADLPYCDWMTALDLSEWKNWHTPRIELSVITDNRPHSLRRLLSSITNARYFGDLLNLRINVEQTADTDTLRIVREQKWDHGEVFVHHRIIHGGLMAAVVESWYPSNNDSYGLILEDDVELSPLFYAWVKMSLLRYRYGKTTTCSPNLFGISLYQQKNLELRPEGRHLFDPRHIFTSAGHPHPDTPYLSQIPCSWGALYFPEHWREFHAYLTARLASTPWLLAEPVVPDVRSNRWTRSWKKFFIELVYLRGYVMLYPNYAGFRSLSTNHLEAGSHVKDIPLDAYLRKKKLFNLPLMPLPPAPVGRGRLVPNTGLLELPNARLPEWESLPVLDLLGAIANEETIARRGRERRTELTGCDGLFAHTHDARELFCLH